MRPTFLILFHACATVSLFLSAVGSYCWVLSSKKLFDVSRVRGPEIHSLTITRSELCLWYNYDGYHEGRASSAKWEWSTAEVCDIEAVAKQLFPPRHPVAGFFLGNRGGHCSMVLMPMALVVPLLGFLPVATIIWHISRRTRRFAQPRCQVCGYDLRASIGTCPECCSHRITPPPIDQTARK